LETVEYNVNNIPYTSCKINTGSLPPVKISMQVQPNIQLSVFTLNNTINSCCGWSDWDGGFISNVCN
jgi:hypothetical protein